MCTKSYDPELKIRLVKVEQFVYGLRDSCRIWGERHCQGPRSLRWSCPFATGVSAHLKNGAEWVQIALQREDKAPEIIVAGERLPAFESLHPLSTTIAVASDGKMLAFSAKSRGRDRLYIWDVEEKRERSVLNYDEIVAISVKSPRRRFHCSEGFLNIFHFVIHIPSECIHFP